MFPWRKSLIPLGLAAAVGAVFPSPAIALGVGGIGVPGLPLGGIAPPSGPIPTGPVWQTLNGLQNTAGTTNLVTLRDMVGRPDNFGGALQQITPTIRIVRGEVLAIAPSPADLAAARALNFAIGSQETFGGLGLQAVRLLAPDGVNAVRALAALRAASPSGTFDFDHIYEPSGAPAEARTERVEPGAAVDAQGLVIGMIDAGIDKQHPALASDEIIAGNVTGSDGAPPTAHGTAVASLLVGRDGSFHGQLPGATLYAADVFGGQATGGSALDITRALDWLAKNNVAVVNTSLAGPPNALLAAAVKLFVGSGHILVAAAGNEGPAAPLAYPAAYDGVVGVTSVDENRRLQIDANRGDVAFAALGVGVRAATLKRRYDTYTGTSFAAPVVAARFALMVHAPDPEAAKAASSRLAKTAQPLGAQSAYGYGYIAPVEMTAAQQ